MELKCAKVSDLSKIVYENGIKVCDEGNNLL